MALQRISQAFRGQPNTGVTQNTIDVSVIAGAGGIPALTAMYTLGTTLIDQPSFQAVGRNWKLLSAAFRASLVIGGGFGPVYGKLGKVHVAVDPNGLLNPTGQFRGNNGSIPPLQPLPPDPTLVTVLWDPAIDPLPPNALALLSPPPSPGLPVTTIIQLPIPLPVSDASVSVGIWVEQSLVASPVPMPQFTAIQAIQVQNATYTLNFDDGS